MLKRLLLSPVVLLMLPASAFARDWTIYSYANGNVLWDLLNAITMWMADSDFKFFCMAIALMGMLGASVMGFIGGSPAKIATYMVGIIIGVVLIFDAKVDVVIQDTVYGAAPGTNAFIRPLPGVPAAAGLPMAIISEIGKSIGDTIDDVYSDPADPATMPSLSSGMPFGGTYGLMNDLGHAKIQDPDLASNVTNYMRYCLLPYLATEWFNVSSLQKAPNFWQAIRDNSWQAVNQYVPVKEWSATGADGEKTNITTSLYACASSEADAGPDAWTIINNQLKTYAPMLLGQFGAGGTMVAMTNTAAAMNVGEWATGTAEGATNIALNSAMMEMTRAGFQQAAQALGADGLLVSLNTENARRAQVSGWYTTSVLFRDMAGYFFAILQAFIIALTPLVAMMAFIPGMGAKIIAGYAKVVLWLMLWWPGLSIVNFIMQSFYKSRLENIAGTCVDGFATCTSSIGVVNDATMNMMIAAGLMATFVPAILWGIVSQGSFALTSVLDRASGSGYATQAGESIAHGAARFGDISMDNANLHKHDTTVRSSNGIEASQFAAGAMQQVTTESAGGLTNTIAGQQSTRTYNSKDQMALTDAHKVTSQVQQSFKEDLGGSLAQSATKMTALANQFSHMENGQRVWSDKAAYGVYQDISHDRAMSIAEAKKHGLTDEQIKATEKAHTDETASGYKLEAGISGSLGLGSSGNVSGKGSIYYQSQAKDATTDKTGNSQKSTDSTSLDTTDTATDKSSVSVKGSQTGDQTVSGGVADSRNKSYLNQLAQDSKSSFAKTFASSQALTEAEAKEASLQNQVANSIDIKAVDNNFGANAALKAGQKIQADQGKMSADLAARKANFGSAVGIDPTQLKNEVHGGLDKTEALSNVAPDGAPVVNQTNTGVDTGTAAGQGAFDAAKTAAQREAALTADKNNREAGRQYLSALSELGIKPGTMGGTKEGLEGIQKKAEAEHDIKRAAAAMDALHAMNSLQNVSGPAGDSRLIGFTESGTPLYAQGKLDGGADSLYAYRSALDGNGHLNNSNYTPQVIGQDGQMQDANMAALNKSGFVSLYAPANAPAMPIDGHGGSGPTKTNGEVAAASKDQGHPGNGSIMPRSKYENPSDKI